METKRKKLLEDQTALRQMLEKPDDFEGAINAFLDHHAKLHSAMMIGESAWSFEDAIIEGMTEENFRWIPPNGEHSVAWLFWHITRIEDATMNVLIADSVQVIELGDWQKPLKVDVLDTGNAMPPGEIAALSRAVDIHTLLDYRVTVGRKTREIVKKLTPGDLSKKPTGEQLQRLRDEGVVRPDAEGLIDYWSKRTVTGLLLMPASRHILVHLNEALQLKKKMRIA